MKQYIIYGNGGHSKVIRDIIEITGGEIVAVYDENHPYNPEAFPNAEAVIAIGNNDIRQKIAQEITHTFATLIHPKAVVASHALIGEGSVILANAVVQEQATIGQHCIIQPNVTIDHDAQIGDFRSEEHTSELQSRENLVCRLLLEKKKTNTSILQSVNK